MNTSSTSHDLQPETAMNILQLLLKIAERHKREYDNNQICLIEKLRGVEQENISFNTFLDTWNKLTATLFSAPHWFSLLMDDVDNELSKKIHFFANKKWLPDLSSQNDYLEWQKKQKTRNIEIKKLYLY